MFAVTADIGADAVLVPADGDELVEDGLVDEEFVEEGLVEGDGVPWTTGGLPPPVPAPPQAVIKDSRATVDSNR